MSYKPQNKTELLLDLINQQITLLASGGTGATEATLQAVLTAVDTMRDYEVRLVVDSDDPAVTWLEVRYWDAQTGALGAPQYYLPGSTTPGTPVAPISYINQQTLLNQILAELEVISGAVHLEVDDDAIASEQELPTNINLLYGAFEGEGVEWERIQTDGNGYLKGISDILIELGLIKTNTNNVATQTTLAALLAAFTAVSRVPSVVNATVNGSTTAGVRSVSLWFRGNNGTLNGVAMPNGARISFSADGENDTLAAIPFVVPNTGEARIIIAYNT